MVTHICTILWLQPSLVTLVSFFRTVSDEKLGEVWVRGYGDAATGLGDAVYFRNGDGSLSCSVYYRKVKSHRGFLPKSQSHHGILPRSQGHGGLFSAVTRSQLNLVATNCDPGHSCKYCRESDLYPLRKGSLLGTHIVSAARMCL